MLVPTLNLLVQREERWRQAGLHGKAVAVCSLDRDPPTRHYLAEELGLRCTTNPLRLALRAGTGPVLVFATYASFVGASAPPKGPTNSGRRTTTLRLKRPKPARSQAFWNRRWPKRSDSNSTGSA